MGQWGLKPGRGEDGASYEELVETEGRPRLRYWLDRILAEGMLDASVAYGYFPVVRRGRTTWSCCTTATTRTASLGVAGLLAPDGGSGGADRHRAAAVHVPAPAPRPPPVPRRLRALEGLRPDRRRRPAAGDRRLGRRQGHREAVRRGQVPRLPRAQRAHDAAHRGARRVLALARPRRARLRRRGSRRHRGHVQAELPRRALLARLPGVPRHGGPPQGRRAAQARADGRRAVGGAAAASRAVDGRVRVPPPRGAATSRSEAPSAAWCRAG